IGTVAAAEANGTIVQAYDADLNAFNVTSLSPATGYFFNVLVKDAAGNKAVYTELNATTTADTVAPVPGNTGTITTSGVSFNSVTLNWAKATDDVTAQTALQYEVRQSASNNIGTVAAAEANGTVVQPYTADLGAKAVTGLAPNTNYYFNVLVKDAAGNKAVYTEVNATTTADTVAPVPGNTGTITMSGVSFNSLTLNWTKATDEVTAQPALQYEVRQSMANNLG